MSVVLLNSLNADRDFILNLNGIFNNGKIIDKKLFFHSEIYIYSNSTVEGVVMYVPTNEVFLRIKVTYPTQNIANKSAWIMTSNLEEELLRQILFAKETNNTITDTKGNIIKTFADYKKEIMP
jgi:hypothetical protein